MIPAITSRNGATWMKASVNETAEPATPKAVKCASPIHVLTADIGPRRSRKNVTAAESAPRAALPSRTEKMAATDNIQFRADHTMQMTPGIGKKSKKALPGCGFASGEAKLTRTAAPTNARKTAGVN